MMYYRQLAFELRSRKLREVAVAAALNEVAGLCADSSQKPSATFGEPHDYAETFEKGTSMPLGNKVMYAIAALAIFQIFAQTAAQSRGLFMGMVGPVNSVWIIGISVLCGAVVTGVVIDHRLPSAFDKNASRAGVAQ